jgi:hypothetical protein
MLFAATPLANFIHAHPSVVMLALGQSSQGLHLRSDAILGIY